MTSDCDSRTNSGLLLARSLFRSAGEIRYLGGNGNRSRVYACDEAGLVLKVFFRDMYLKAMRETISLKMLHQVRVNTPVFLDYSVPNNSPSWVLMSKMASQMTIEDLRHQLPAHALSSLCNSLGSTLASIHDAVPLAFSGELPEGTRRFANPIEFARYRYCELADYVLQRCTKPEEHLLAARKHLLQLLHLLENCDIPESVWLHMDTGFRNTLVQETSHGWAVLGLIDFEKAQAGDPAEDIAKYIFRHCLEEGSVISPFISGYRQIRSIDKSWFHRVKCYILGNCFDVLSWSAEIAPVCYRHACRCLDLVREDALPLHDLRE